MRRHIGSAIYALSAAIGILVLLHPLLGPLSPVASLRESQQWAISLLTAGMLGLSVVALLLEAQGQTLSAKTIAMLGVLVAVTSVLRFIEVAMPLPGGFSPIFAFIIIAGHVFGARFGFLMGTFSLLVSALITGGVGPWLPFQMFAAGWVGLTSGWVRARGRRWERYVLYGLGGIWGFLYGVVINLYFWPIAVAPQGQAWDRGLSLGEVVGRYAAFYAATSLAWDVARAVGNVALLVILAVPMAKVLLRFRQRFHFEVADG
jgi:energy-coupling factor transport system substrate-specific component